MAPPFGFGHHRFGAGHLGVVIGCWTLGSRKFGRRMSGHWTHGRWTGRWTLILYKPFFCGLKDNDRPIEQHRCRRRVSYRKFDAYTM